MTKELRNPKLNNSPLISPKTLQAKLLATPQLTPGSVLHLPERQMCAGERQWGAQEGTAAGQGFHTPGTPHARAGLLLSAEDGPNPSLEASGYISVKGLRVRPLLIVL